MRFDEARAFVCLYPEWTRRSLIVAMTVSAALAVLDLVSLLLLLPVFATLTAGGDDKTPSLPWGLLEGVSAQLLVALAMSAMIARSVLGFVVRYWWGRRVAAAEVALGSAVLSRYAYAPYEFHLSANSSVLMSKVVAQTNTFTATGLNGVVLVVSDMTTVLALSAALLVASPLAGIVVFAYLTAIGLAFVYLSRRFTARQASAFNRYTAEVYRRVAMVLQGIRELTVSGGVRRVLEAVDASRVRMTRAQRNMIILSDVPRVTLESALYAAVLVALSLILASDHPGHSLALVALYVVAGLRVLPTITRALGTLTQVRYAINLGNEMGSEMTELARATPPPARPAGPGLPRRGTLTLESVTFSYGSGDAVLRDVSLDVPFGDFVALVGPSGGGKSTLLGVVLGLLAPSRGTVRYACEPIGLAAPEWLSLVGYLPQEAFVLDDDVVANVALGDPDPDEARVWQALDRAAVGELVRSMPDGLQTMLREGGARLSVGQRQRLGLARALYRDPAVLILDEPTAALDASSEARVMATVRQLAGTLTIIMVSHRMSTVEGADMILRLDDGRLHQVSLAEVEGGGR